MLFNLLGYYNFQPTFSTLHQMHFLVSGFKYATECQIHAEQLNHFIEVKYLHYKKAFFLINSSLLSLVDKNRMSQDKSRSKISSKLQESKIRISARIRNLTLKCVPTSKRLISTGTQEQSYSAGMLLGMCCFSCAHGIVLYRLPIDCILTKPAGGRKQCLSWRRQR